MCVYLFVLMSYSVITYFCIQFVFASLDFSLWYFFMCLSLNACLYLMHRPMSQFYPRIIFRFRFNVSEKNRFFKGRYFPLPCSTSRHILCNNFKEKLSKWKSINYFFVSYIGFSKYKKHIPNWQLLTIFFFTSVIVEFWHFLWIYFIKPTHRTIFWFV